jgi:hypothetical protein
MISLPFQNNTKFGIGPGDDTQNILNIQPVWPFSVNENWNFITRTIVPVVSQPGLSPGESHTSGLGDITFTGWLAPKESGDWIWGVGGALVMPTATDNALGNDRWSVGPSVVVLTMPGKWVIGSLCSNVWSFAGSGDQDVNFLPGNISSTTTWITVGTSVSAQASAYYNVETPEFGADWQLRLQLQMLFPK